jgi:hypothetical protein
MNPRDVKATPFCRTLPAMLAKRPRRAPAGERRGSRADGTTITTSTFFCKMLLARGLARTAIS